MQSMHYMHILVQENSFKENSRYSIFGACIVCYPFIDWANNTV